MLGQLPCVHKKAVGVPLPLDRSFVEDYLGRIWTDDGYETFVLLGLGDSIGFVTYSDEWKVNIAQNVVPTLSPKDPNFPAWWEEHKAEWETEQ